MSQIILRPKNTVIVCNSNPNFFYTNNYYKQVLFVGTQPNNSIGAGDYNVLLNFDFSPIPPNARIKSAILYLKLTNLIKNTTTITAYENSTSYNCLKVNWNNQPFINSKSPVNLGSTIVNSTNTSGLIDLTNGFNPWILGGTLANGITLVGTGVQNNNPDIVCINNSTSSPYIKINYDFNLNFTRKTQIARDTDDNPIDNINLNSDITESPIAQIFDQSKICFQLNATSLTPTPPTPSVIYPTSYYSVTSKLQISNDLNNWWTVNSYEFKKPEQAILASSIPSKFAKIIISAYDQDQLKNVNITTSAYVRN